MSISILWITIGCWSMREHISIYIYIYIYTNFYFSSFAGTVLSYSLFYYCLPTGHSLGTFRPVSAIVIIINIIILQTIEQKTKEGFVTKILQTFDSSSTTFQPHLILQLWWFHDIIWILLAVPRWKPNNLLQGNGMQQQLVY